MDSSGSGQGPVVVVVGSYEHVNDPLCSTEGGVFLTG